MYIDPLGHSDTPRMTAREIVSGWTIYVSPLVHSLSLDKLQFVPLAAVVVDPQGIIHQVEELDDLLSEAQITAKCDQLKLELQDQVVGESVSISMTRLNEGYLCPGLVDTHCHAPQYPNIGLGSDRQLLDRLERVTFPTEVKFGDLGYARQVYEKVIRRTLNAGTTTPCYYATIYEESTKLLVDLCEELGQRAFVGKCCMDRNSPSNYIETTEQSISSTKSFLKHFDSSKCTDLPSLVQPILTPRFAVSCTPELLSSLAIISSSRIPSIPIQTHMAENPLECAWVKEMFAGEAQGEEWGDTYAGVYEHYGLMGPGTILAHCVHLNDEQKEIIRRTGAGVSHCPGSNLFLNSGAARIRELLDLGIKVGLGPDCSGGPSIGILSAIRSASHVSKFLSFPTLAAITSQILRPKPLSTPNLFYLATVGGAALCRLENSIGNFLPGKQFDALWVRPRSPGIFAEPGETLEDLFEKWIWGGDDRDLGSVWVRGRRVGGFDDWG